MNIYMILNFDSGGSEFLSTRLRNHLFDIFFDVINLFLDIFDKKSKPVLVFLEGVHVEGRPKLRLRAGARASTE